MSWNISANGTKDEVKEKIRNDMDFKYLPAQVASMVETAIDALPDCEDSNVTISTYGHFNTGEYHGTSNMTIMVTNSFNP